MGTNLNPKFDPQRDPYLPVSDLESMRRFYVDTVGFEEEFYNPGEMLGLSMGGRSIIVLMVSDAGPIRVELILDVADVDSAVVELEKRGVEMTRRPTDGQIYGGRVAAFNDPEGNTVNIVQSARS